MTVNPHWASMMTQTVTIEPYSSPGSHIGKETYGTGVEYRARFVEKTRLVRSASGEELAARGVVWINASSGISTKDRITLPDDTQPPILAVESYPDEMGNTHLKLILGF